MEKVSTLICGGGITGLALAREMLRQGHRDIAILEKESQLGVHASGRNSGVLHAGVYYPADSLKARFCLRGNQLLRQYCREKGIPVLDMGKVIVARNPAEVPTLETIYQRAEQNGAKVEWLAPEKLAEVEPYAATCEKAIYSHYTGVVDSRKVLFQIKEDLEATGEVQFWTGTKFLHRDGTQRAYTSRGGVEYDFFINAAGNHSDLVAKEFGLGRHYQLIPFKGLYYKLREEKSHLCRGNIYPVPDIRNPFLGVHFTRNIHGQVYLGPTAIPAFGRENYGILEGLDREALSILAKQFILLWFNPKFRQVALTEPRKYWFRYFFADARKLVKDLDPADVISSDKVGIRPQLIDWRTREMVMDFTVLAGGRSVHILNAISPAFTSSMAFAEHVYREYVKKILG